MTSRILPLLLALLLAGTAQAAPRPLQPLIDATPPGGTLVLEPGTYAGPAVIARPMTLDGSGRATLDGGGSGTILSLEGTGVTVQNLRVVNSGRQQDLLDSGILVRGRYHIIKDNVFEDCLFGVNLQQADHSVVRRNRFDARDDDPAERGDAIRLWYSMDNVVQDNVAVGTRDLSVWYSNNNRIVGNRSTGGRYGLRFMHAKHNVAERNVLERNMVGIFAIHSEGIQIRGNRIARSGGAPGGGIGGIGIGLKESDSITVAGNEVLANATGLYIDVSPNDPEAPNTIEGNRVAYNGIAVRFHSDGEGNRIRGNDFLGNFGAVAVEGGGSALRHEWAGNHWDTYEGFDRDGNGVGDSPFEVYAHADRLWMDLPVTQFFRASPMLEMLDFMERLAPFGSPRLLMRETAPAVRPVAGAS
ncbi:nitrous oxide reductase family maturation protein NosD [Azospirillum sp.]|uniref:nitrous oxide reductase family maturation protein NosD n=1 Tax=Azospirillum sp. TaxID=34012 RepID=UPI003D74392C